MRHARILIFGAALFLVPTLASAQGWGWGRDDANRDRDNDGYRDVQSNRSYAFQQGWRQGRSDYFSNRRTSIDKRRYKGRERGEWQSGYAQGYNDARRDARNRNGGYGRDGRYGQNNGEWGQNGGYGQNTGGLYNNGAKQARDVGYNDGRIDGERDRRTGHSFRFTQQDNYKHGDRGFDSSFGSRDAYKLQYRSAYEQGYRQGYGYR